MLAFTMVLGIAGCGKANNSSTPDIDEADFETTSNGSGGTGDSDNTDIDIDDNVSSGGTTTAAVTNADSLSWNQLVSQMPASLKGSTLRVYNWNPIKEYTGGETVKANFEKMTGIKVSWEQGGYDDYDSKIAAMVSSGNSPDIIRFRDPCIHRMYYCNDIKTATGYDCKGAIWDSKVSDKYTVKGKIYAVNRKDTFFQSPMVIIYRKSMIEATKGKLEDPYVLYKNGKWTWDKFIEMCTDYKELATTNDPWRTNTGVDYIYFSGNSLFTFNGSTYKNNLGSNVIGDCIKKMCDYRKNNLTSSAMRMPKQFDEGRILFMTFSAIATRRTNTSAKIVTAKQEDDLYCVPIPSIAGVKGQHFSELEAYGVCKGAKNGAGAYYFLRYFLDSANYDANTFFCNKQAYEVYKACMAKSEYYCPIDNALIDVVGTGGNLDGLSDWVREGGNYSQFATERDAIMKKYDLAAKKANEVLAKFK